MPLHQLVKADQGWASYLVADTEAFVCAVVDPPLDMIDDILEYVAARGLRITAVIESHVPADSPSGSRELARRIGAPIYTYELVTVDYPHRRLPDGIFRLFSTGGALPRGVSQPGASYLSAEANKVMVCRYLEEVVHEGNVDAIDVSIATNHRLNLPGSPTPMYGPEGFKQLLILYTSAFPDLEWTMEEVAAQGETVVARLRARGTHQREVMGMLPTGKQVTWTETHIFHMAGGKLVEHWTNLDQVGLLQQLGVLPRSG